MDKFRFIYHWRCWLYAKI